MRKVRKIRNYLKNGAVIIVIITTALITTHCNSSNNADFNSEKFVPDTIYKTIFTWRDVKHCLQNQLDSKKYVGKIDCPKCGKKSENLIWVEFISPDWTWKHLAGRQGPLSICPNCKIQVEFICEIMN